MPVRVDWRVSLALVGTVCKYLAVPLSAPLVLAPLYGEPATPFVVAVAVALAAGVGLERLTERRELGPREALLMVALAWLVVALVGAVPFVVAGDGTLATPVNALFESTSAITTTGATVVLDFGAHTRSVLFWRQLLQWLGGLGILVLATAVLSQLGVGGAQLMETESQTRDVTKLTPTIAGTARLLGSLYVGLTAAQVLLLYGLNRVGLAPEMTLYDAVAHAFTTVSTSGFSPRAASLGAFSPAVQWVVVAFMVLGATNFVLMYLALQGNRGRLLDSEEFRAYVGVLAAASAVAAGLLVAGGAAPVESTLRDAVFQVVSIVTTTGYATVDYTAWSPAAKHLLFMGMFVGGMAGSTTCSIKVLRWLIVVKAFRRDLFTAARPSAVRPVRLSGRPVEEETIRDIYAYTLVSLLFFFAATVFVAIDASRSGLALTEFESMGAAAATFFNIGPAFGVAGPFGSYEAFSPATKLVMTFLMWVGRIEIIPVLVVLTPSFWRR